MYAFYNLPYCAPQDIEVKREDLGPLLKGDRPTKTLYDIKFRGAWQDRSACRVPRAECRMGIAAAAAHGSTARWLHPLNWRL